MTAVRSSQLGTRRWAFSLDVFVDPLDQCRRGLRRGRWNVEEAVSGTINMLCSDRYTDIGEGATYQSTYLDVGAWPA